MDKKDKEFVKELQKRIGTLTADEKTASTAREATAIVRAAVDSMIKDGCVGPAFYQEVDVKVDIDKETGIMNVSFAVIDPTGVINSGMGDLL